MQNWFRRSFCNFAPIHQVVHKNKTTLNNRPNRIVHTAKTPWKIQLESTSCMTGEKRFWSSLCNTVDAIGTLGRVSETFFSLFRFHTAGNRSPTPTGPNSYGIAYGLSTMQTGHLFPPLHTSHEKAPPNNTTAHCCEERASATQSNGRPRYRSATAELFLNYSSFGLICKIQSGEV